MSLQHLDELALSSISAAMFEKDRGFVTQREDVIVIDMNKLKEEGIVWGYDIPYMLTGRMNQHPRDAIQFIADKRTDYASFSHYLYDKDSF